MSCYPNQKNFTIKRTLPNKEEKKAFISAYTDNIAAASRNLGEIAFKFYIYLLSNKDGYTFDYSPQHFANYYGVSLDRARRVPQQLMEAGYLVEGDKNHYVFYELPQEQKKEIVLENIGGIDIERRKIVYKNGTFDIATYEEWYAAANGRLPNDLLNEWWNNAEVVK